MDKLIKQSDVEALIDLRIKHAQDQIELINNALNRGEDNTPFFRTHALGEIQRLKERSQAMLNIRDALLYVSGNRIEE